MGTEEKKKKKKSVGEMNDKSVIRGVKDISNHVKSARTRKLGIH